MVELGLAGKTSQGMRSNRASAFHFRYRGISVYRNSGDMDQK